MRNLNIRVILHASLINLALVRTKCRRYQFLHIPRIEVYFSGSVLATKKNKNWSSNSANEVSDRRTIYFSGLIVSTGASILVEEPTRLLRQPEVR